MQPSKAKASEKKNTPGRARKVTTTFSSVFPLSKGESGETLFFLPDFGGSVFYAQKFIAAFEKTQPIYGFRLDPTTDWSTSTHDLSFLAEKFAEDLIRSDHPEPYHLVGHSFAGILAFETARQLELKGAVVGILAILDTAVPPRFRIKAWSDWALYVPKLITGLSRYLVHRLPEMSFREILGKVRSRFLGQKSVPLSQKHHKHLRCPGYATINLAGHPEAYRSLITHMYKAMTEYQPRNYEGDAMIFRSKQRNFLEVHSHHLGWLHYINGTLETHRISGGHLDMVRGDIPVSQVTGILAQKLRTSP